MEQSTQPISNDTVVPYEQHADEPKEETIPKMHQMGEVPDMYAPVATHTSAIPLGYGGTAMPVATTAVPVTHMGHTVATHGSTFPVHTAGSVVSHSGFQSTSSKVVHGNPTHRLNMESRAHGLVDPSHKKMNEAYAREVTLMMSQSGITSTDMVIEKATSYVEVPVVEYVDKKLPKKIVVEREQIVPKREIEYVEKIVYVPEVQVVEKIQEVEEIEVVTKQVPIKQVIDVPKEYIRNVPKIEVRQVEKVIEKPIIENVPRPYVVEQEIYIPNFSDKLALCAVSQIAQSEIVASADELECDVKKYVPYLVPVDVFVPRPVQVQLIATGKRLWEDHRIVELPAAHFNSLLQVLNWKLVTSGDYQKYLPYVMEANGEVTLLADKLNDPLVLQETDVTDHLRMMLKTYFPSHISTFNVGVQDLMRRLKEECERNGGLTPGYGGGAPIGGSSYPPRY